MKLVIELDDADLEKMVANQLKAVISREVHDQLGELVDKIIATKADRIESLMEKSIDKTVLSQVGNSFALRDKMDRLFEKAAIAVVRERMK
jgi:hypothetical protein